MISLIASQERVRTVWWINVTTLHRLILIKTAHWNEYEVGSVLLPEWHLITWGCAHELIPLVSTLHLCLVVNLLSERVRLAQESIVTQVIIEWLNECINSGKWNICEVCEVLTYGNI